MKKIFFLTFLLAALTSAVRGQTETILPSESEAGPEHIYILKNGNGVWMTSYTSPTRTEGNAGKFAFFADEANADACFIYSVDRKKWVSYTKAASYSNGTNFAVLVDDRSAANPWKAVKATVSGADYYQFAPYTTTTVAGKYMNWYRGVGNDNPEDNTTVTVGLWQDNASSDAGSRWAVSEVVMCTYTVSLAPGESVTINGQTYTDGQTLTVSGQLTPANVIAAQKEGKFGVVSVDNDARTISVVYYDLPELRTSEAYTNAWVYPKQQDNVGAAASERQDNVYTLYNNVLAASFLKTDKALYFLGSKAMNLMAGSEPFIVGFGTGDKVAASQMTLTDFTMTDLTANPDAVGGAEHYAGKALEAVYTYTYKGQTIRILWRAVLRDGSHYLRTEMELTGVDDVDMYDIIAMNYNVDAAAAGSKPATVGNTRGKVIMSDRIFAGLETPTAYNTVGAETGEADNWDLIATPVTETLSADAWTQLAAADVPARVIEVGGADKGYYIVSRDVTLKKNQKATVTLTYKSGNKRFDLDGADLLDRNSSVVASDYHHGYTGTAKENNTFSFFAPNDGDFTVRVFCDNREGDITSTAEIKVEVYEAKAGVDVSADVVNIQGRWSRNTTLAAGQTWKVAAVVGLIAQDGRQSEASVGKTQKRRSFLAYSERERAVPWRAFPCYISWYELNINRNNAAPGSENTNMVADQVLDVLAQWKTQMFDKFGEGPASFVIDDGWDNYGTWTFHSGFPNEMRDIAYEAARMGAGCGAWLGPVGGYGQSGNYRRSYWNSDNRGGMQLSNPAYYQVFLDAADNLVKNQHRDGLGQFNFFKFDGISAQFSAVGPDNGDTGNENAEGIIRLEQYVRENLKEDIFFNTTVGTWASPFWYQVSDATWRQENDHGRVGDNSVNRENWITYRDNLVHQNYVTNSPICPINTLMTHGFILTKFGPPADDSRDYRHVLNELRCAFACGSGMVELYNDYDLMNSINGGQLWADLAECIRWQKNNADVLMDSHWVGGDPWTGSKAEIYGWGAWNGEKSCLTLRNGANGSQTITLTLREALEIPANVSGSITLRKAFAVQDALEGLAEGQAIDIDSELTLTLPGSSVFVFDGLDSSKETVDVTGIAFDKEEYTVEEGSTVAVNATVLPANATDRLLTWTSDNEQVATVSNGLVRGVAPGKAVITAVSQSNGTVMASATVTVTEKVREPYSVNFDKNISKAATGGRALSEIVFATASGTSRTLTIDSSTKRYVDLTEDAGMQLDCRPGENVSVTLRHGGSWMHGYVYIDLEGDGQFSFNDGSTDQSGTDLVSFFFYSGFFTNDASGVNSLGEAISGGARNPGATIVCPDFAAPSRPGTYRVRFKVDWNSVDAGGQIAADGTCTGANGILANSGTIVDATLNVSVNSGIGGITADPAKEPVYDLSGRRVDSPASRGVFIQGGRKVVK